MKKIILFVMALLLIFNVVVFAEDAVTTPEYGVVPPTTKAPEERLVPGELNITINGKVIYFAYKAYAENERTYAHGEKLLKELGYDVNCDKASGVLSATKGASNLEFKVGEGSACLVENALFIPVRATMENLGYTVNWNGEKYLVEIVGDQND